MFMYDKTGDLECFRWFQNFSQKTGSKRVSKNYEYKPQKSGILFLEYWKNKSLTPARCL